MTPAEVSAIIQAKLPADDLTKRREIEEVDMTPEQIATKLKFIAASYGGQDGRR
jgi:hypothetical protein